MRKILRNLDRSLGRGLTASLALFDRLTSLVRGKTETTFQPRCILAIKLVGIGDAVLMLTALDRLRTHLPRSKICVLTTPLSSGILEDQPQIDEMIIYDIFGKERGIRGFFNVLRRLRNLNPDCTIDFEQHFQSTAILSYLIGTPRRIGLYYHGNPRKHLFTHPVFLDPQSHMVTSYLRLLEPLGVDSADLEELVSIRLAEEDRNKVDDWLVRLDLKGSNLAGIHAGSGIRAPFKRWSSTRFADLIKRLSAEGFTIFLTGNQDEAEYCSQIIEKSGARNVYNVAGLFSIKQTAYLISKCGIFISNDTGPMHIAAAMGTPTIGIFGPESPKRYAPFGRLNTSVYQGANCSPCVEIYRGHAPECTNPVCMENISVDDVWRAVRDHHLGSAK